MIHPDLEHRYHGLRDNPVSYVSVEVKRIYVVLAVTSRVFRGPSMACVGNKTEIR